LIGNENYKCKGCCLHYKNWITSGILYVKDIMGDEGDFISEKEIFDKLKNKTNWISEFTKVKNACKNVVKFCAHLTPAHINIVKHEPTLFYKNTRYDVIGTKSKFYYAILTDKKFQYPFMQKVWYKKLQLENLKFQSSWQQIYEVKIKNMPIKKLCEFNYKVLSATLPCGKTL